MKPSFALRHGLCLGCLFIHFSHQSLRAANITWIGGNVDWVDNSGNANWSPADEPDLDDVAIFNTANTVNLGSDNLILGLTLSGSASLKTNSKNLVVDGLVQLANSTFTVGVAGSNVTADSVTINNNGNIVMDLGALVIIEETGSGALVINSGGTLGGRGSVSSSDALAAITTVFFNNGTISASPVGLILFGSPAAGTLSFGATSANARIDLDGPAESGNVNMSRNQTLDINLPLSDSFAGTMAMVHNSVFDISAAWSMNGGTLTATNGFVAGSPPFIPSISASTSFIRGGGFSQNGGTITNVDSDGTLQFDATLNMTGGNLVNNGTVVFNANATIGAGANFTMPTATSSIAVTNAAQVVVNQANFNADGNGVATNLLTIESSGLLDLNLGVGGDTSVQSAVRLNGGTLDLTSTTGSWSLMRSVTTGASSGTSKIEGSPVSVSGTVTVATGSTLDCNLVSTWTGSSTVNGLLLLGGDATLTGGSFVGPGTLRLGSTSNVTANTIINTTTFDWDGTGIGSVHTINDGIAFTINSTVLDSDGDMDDPITLGGNSAAITMNGVSEWTMTNALTANSGGIGSALINGSARLILTGATAGIKAVGNTTVTSPITFGASSVTTVSASRTLSTSNGTVFDGGSVGGAGIFTPAGTISVLSSSTISADVFDFDGAYWNVESGATLTINVVDYDTVATNEFGTAITLNHGRISVITGDPEFIMDGTLNMNDNAGPTTEWQGEPMDIGNDNSSVLAKLNVYGTSQSSIFAQVDFNSDARVNVAAGSILNLVGTANFDTVNGADHATFTGSGTFSITGNANFNEAVTFDMSGGSIDLDGSDGTGSTIFLPAPVVMNVASLQSFGKTNGSGTNILEIDHSVGTGSLTVNLDNPGDEWTLNGPGVLNLLNGNAPITLLSGAAAKLNGIVNVTGDVRTTARVDIGGTINIQTAGEPFRLAGGDLTTTNTIAGGIVNGPGLLGADTGASLSGFGTIAANIDFDGSSDLIADGGILNVTGSIVDVRNVISRTGGIMNVVNAWNSSVLNSITLLGGEIRGGQITLDNTFGITGVGWVSSKVINNTRIGNSGVGVLIVQTTGNDNDWDGAANAGTLNSSFGTLELHDNAAFTFGGTVNATSGGTVFASGFALNPGTSSTINLTNGHFTSTNTTSFAGPIVVSAGGSSSLEVASPNLLDLLATSSVNLTGNLSLVTTNGRIRSGATFSGGGSLIVPSGSTVAPDAGANIGVLVENSGTLRIAGTPIGRNDVHDYQQNANGKLEVGLSGTGLADFDRLVANGAAQVAGTLDLKLIGGFVPALGQTFNFLSATSGVTGTFTSIVQPVGMPAGLKFRVNYQPTLLQLEVVNASAYDTWIDSFASLTNPADRLKSANPDGDSLNNLGEFALDGDPTSGGNSGRIFGKIAPVATIPVMTLTLAVRTGALPAAGDPAGGELVLEQTADSLFYAIQASDNLVTTPLTVSEVTGPDATAIQVGLPALHAGWGYRTFRSPGPVAGDPEEFMRVFIHD